MYIYVYLRLIVEQFRVHVRDYHPTSFFSNFSLNVYADSAALSMQALSPRFHKVPRVFFTLLAFLIFTVASIAGRQHFSAILSNFLAVVRIHVATPQLVIECSLGEDCILDRYMDSDSCGGTLYISSEIWCTRGV